MPFIELSKLPKKLSQLSRVHNFAAAAALTQVAFEARKAVIKSVESKFEIKSEWVRRGVLVNKANRNDQPIQTEVFHRYWGLAQQEEGGLRMKSKPERWIIPTKKGEKWLKKAGFKRKPKLKKILKTEVSGRKPFFITTGARTGNRKGTRTQLTPDKLPNERGVPIWTRVSDNAKPLDLLFIAYDQPLAINSKDWFDKTVEKVYNNRIETVFNEQLKKNLKKVLTS